jgi:hypothetical protein
VISRTGQLQTPSMLVSSPALSGVGGLPLVCGAIVITIGQPDLSFQDGPLAPVVRAHDPIVRFAINQGEQPKDGVAPGRKSRRRWHNGLIDLKTVISHMTRYWLRLCFGEATALYANC